VITRLISEEKIMGCRARAIIAPEKLKSAALWTGKTITVSMNSSEQDLVRCNYCRKQIAVLSFAADAIDPSPEELMNQGCVPVPDFGWFCSQDCGDKHGQEYRVRFRRNGDNQIRYYQKRA
jgi:hypothetical protein